jgi:hypothetical protein
MVQILPESPSFGSQLGRNLGTGLSQGISSGVDFASKLGVEKEKSKLIINALIEKGVSPEDAQLYSRLTKGGQTAFVKDVLESEKRKKDLSPFNPLKRQKDLLGSEQKTETEEQLSPEEMVDREIEQENYIQDLGLTPAERVKREKERFDTGYKKYEESGAKLRGMTRDKERLDILEKLNSSDKLPQNMGRLNVDKEGNLRFPFASTPEAERFIKTLNEFSAGAKDTYGSRVTNFDLQQYMRRYPTLVNSKEGRRQILQQMKIVNQINSTYYKNLKDAYDKAGGVRKIDADRADMLAEKKSEPKIQELVKKFDQIGQFPTLPNAAEFKGSKIRNKETGEIMVSDGKNWIPEEK